MSSTYDAVFFKTVDESPKFRRDNIVANLTTKPDVVKTIISVYKLKLVDEVYLRGISSKSYNGNKRNKLKIEEIILIKKIKVYDLAQSNLTQIFKNSLEYERQFKEHFDFPLMYEEDRVFSKQILVNFYEDFINEHENKN